jgi:hypothetical protein
LWGFEKREILTPQASTRRGYNKFVEELDHEIADLEGISKDGKIQP